jgi:Carbohydrate binding module (family 6).
MYPEFMTGII